MFAILVPLVLVLLLGAGILFYMFYAPRHVRFEVSRGKLQIRGDIYGRTIPLTELDLNRARTANLILEPELRPKYRTNGTGLPGYSAGWFRLANGSKALLFVTNREHVIVVPDTKGWLLLMSVADGTRFLSALQQAAH